MLTSTTGPSRTPSAVSSRAVQSTLTRSARRRSCPCVLTAVPGRSCGQDTQAPRRRQSPVAWTKWPPTIGNDHGGPPGAMRRSALLAPLGGFLYSLASPAAAARPACSGIGLHRASSTGLLSVSGVPYPGRQGRPSANHRDRRHATAKIKHIALSTHDVEKTATFYIDECETDHRACRSRPPCSHCSAGCSAP